MGQCPVNMMGGREFPNQTLLLLLVVTIQKLLLVTVGELPVIL